MIVYLVERSLVVRLTVGRSSCFELENKLNSEFTEFVWFVQVTKSHGLWLSCAIQPPSISRNRTTAREDVGGRTFCNNSLSDGCLIGLSREKKFDLLFDGLYVLFWGNSRNGK